MIFLNYIGCCIAVGLGEDGKDVEWERLKHRFEDSLSPVEEKVTEKLRKQIAGARNPTVLVAVFQRYIELMKREGLRRALRGERESLLTALDDLIESCQAGPDTGSLLDSPRILQEVQSARAAELRLGVLKNLANELLADLPGYKNVSEKIAEAAKNSEKRRQHLVNLWVKFKSSRWSILGEYFTLKISSKFGWKNEFEKFMRLSQISYDMIWKISGKEWFKKKKTVFR